MKRRVLCVDDEEIIRTTLSAILSTHGYQVSAAATVTEALQKITSESYDVLISDLNIGNAGDGLTVVSAMRRTQPDAVTMILTGYPAFETALEAIRQQVDEYIVKPANIPALLQAIEAKLALPRGSRQLPPPKRVATILEEQQPRIEELWLASLDQKAWSSPDPCTAEERLAQVRSMLDCVIRAEATEGTGAGGPTAPGGCAAGLSSAQHTPHVLLAKFCVLRRVIAQVVQENLLAVNLSYVVPDLAWVNANLDEQAQASLDLLANQGGDAHRN